MVLAGARNPLNIGAAARAMSNFGFGRLRVVNVYKVAFREARSAVGAAKLLKDAEEYTTVAEAVADCSLVVGTTAIRHRELHHPLVVLQEGARRIRKEISGGRVALLFGSEKYGLSNHEMSHCHWLMHIPTQADHISMNLGQAVAVALYEISRGKKPPAEKRKIAKANAGDVERITALLLEALRESGYIQPSAAESSEDKIRRLVRRLELEKHDAELWLGMLRQIGWKIHAAERQKIEASREIKKAPKRGREESG